MQICTMFEKLQRKWMVGPKRLWVILAAFALGGSLCGFLGKKLMALTGMDKGALYIITYILIVTILWPVCVITISSILGEYTFFKNYLEKIFTRIIGFKQYNTPRIALFASGGGSNAEVIMQRFSGRNSKIRVALIVCNRKTAGVIERAQKFAVPSYLINKNDLSDPTELIDKLNDSRITHIVLAGFLQKVPNGILRAFPNKIINIHPALLPKYGGKGMYGHYVHEAVKANGDSKTGISIHLVDDEYDEGKLVFQQSCNIEPQDSALGIAEKVLKLEHEHFAPVIEEWILSDSQTASLNKR